MICPASSNRGNMNKYPHEALRQACHIIDNRPSDIRKPDYTDVMPDGSLMAVWVGEGMWNRFQLHFEGETTVNCQHVSVTEGNRTACSGPKEVVNGNLLPYDYNELRRMDGIPLVEPTWEEYLDERLNWYRRQGYSESTLSTIRKWAVLLCSTGIEICPEVSIYCCPMLESEKLGDFWRVEFVSRMACAAIWFYDGELRAQTNRWGWDPSDDESKEEFILKEVTEENVKQLFDLFPKEIPKEFRQFNEPVNAQAND